eukprot:TRINITY_DN27281_c0_g1_i1.p1 TRINITY_DN27281_c0_g1~~TRINITY_DN27281_c0_g1_i1.p1  ORF type:complete len:284 (-),score=82.36 TRINITY_DN27281_c0_g1_i1:95-946(-)
MEFSELPEEIILQCLAFVDVHDVAKVATVCSRFCGIVEVDLFWRLQYERLWGAPTLSDAVCWKALYQLKMHSWKRAIPMFNDNPAQAVEILFDERRVGRSPEELTAFLLETPHLHPQMVGSLLGSEEMAQFGLTERFLSKFDFAGLEPDEALRVLLARVLLPPSSQKMRVFLKAIGARFLACNPDHLLGDLDAVYVMLYCVLVLNTDLHNRLVKNKLSKEHFTALVINGPHCPHVPHEYLEALYERIKRNRLCVRPTDNEESGSSTTTLWDSVKSRIRSMFSA